jgi:hypothetical protein
LIKDLNPEIITMVGGHQAGIAPWDFANSNIDYVLLSIGENERGFPSLADPGIVGRE